MTTLFQPRYESALSLCITKSLSLYFILSGLFLLFNVEFATAQLTQVIKVNFSDAGTAPPGGFVRDYGLAYGARTGTEQGTSGQSGHPNYTFGWVAPGTSTGVNLSTLGRNRTSFGVTDVALATFMHMDHPTQTNPRGNWEIALPAGNYKVTVSVGDGQAGSDPERYRINAEGVNLIDLYIPSGGNASPTRFSSGSGIVNVSDGKLTIDYAGIATNGQTAVNTKINFVIIEPQRLSEPVFPTFPIQVNFQNPNTIPPADWLADYGQAYGARTSAYQGSGHTFGWVQLANPNTPLNLAAGGDQPGNGRTRNFAATGSAIIDATFMHMQYAGTNGTAASGSWKIDVPNGFYTVTVKAGEQTTEGTAGTLHRLEVEGIADVVNYNPFNPVSETNSPTGSVTVNVTDGNILIKPTGSNAKIISATIAQAAPPSNLPPVVANPNQTIKLFDNQSINSNIAQINASDPDAGQSLTYAITSGNTNNTFAIDNNGQITLNTNLNYGSTPTYILGITVSDNGSPQGTANATVNVNVSEFITTNSFPYQVNFQDAAALPPSGWLKDFGQAFGNRTDNQQGSGFTYGWRRRDNNAPLDLTANGRNRNRPSITLLQNTLMHMQANDLASFTGTQIEGIWEIDVPNGMYQVSVSVGDQPGGGNIYDSQHTIIVEGVNAINLFQATAANEFQSATVIVSVNDGKLTLDAGGAGGNNTKINSVTIAQYTNQAPLFANATYNFSVAEDADNGTVVNTVSASDPENGTLTYSITAGNTGNVFAINNNGQITIANPLNFEANNNYSLTVSATDNGSPALNATTTVNIVINNVNEAPTLTAATFSMAEDAATGTVVGTASASDPENNNLSFAITNGNTGNAFAIDNSGQITVNNSLNFESQSAYNLTVTVTDDGSPSLNNSALITINVQNINETPTVNAATFNVPEHSPNGTVVGSVTANDPDSGTTLSYAITGGNTSNVFAIDNNGQITVADDIEYNTQNAYNLEVTVTDNGSPTLSASATITVNIQEVTVPNQTPIINAATFNLNENLNINSAIGNVSASDPDNHNLTYEITAGNIGNAFAINSLSGELSLVQALDFESTTVYNLTIKVTDDGVPNLSATNTITINIQNVNEAPIVNPATFSIIENGTNGTPIGDVVAIDPDAGQTLTFAITNGNIANAFIINANTGQISLNGALNYLTTPTYSLTVEATDNGSSSLSGTAVITINVEDFNENPIINPATFNVSENASVGTLVGTVTASDPDNNSLIYSILTGNTNNDFNINPNTGEITTAKSLNFNTLQTYTLNIQVSDNGSPSLSASANITINVTDVNYPPSLTAANFNVQETATVGTLVGTITASDPDAGQTLTFAITNGNTNNAFSINNNGQISVASTLNFNTQAVYNLTIEVSDNGNPIQTTSNSFTINILDAITPSDFPYQVNFQDPNTVPPSGWIRDFGQAYGARTGAHQGAGFTYGWVSTDGTTPLNLSVGGTAGNGRNRNAAATGTAIIDATLMHMQYNNVPNGTNGTPQEGFWKIDLPNGVYDVTVRVGDLAPETNAATNHLINVENVTNVVSYTPTLNSVGFLSGTKIVRVSDGNLLITATGGFNTKIISAIIAQHTNQAPTIANAITDQSATVGQAFNFQVPSNTFNDIEGDALTFTATLADNSPLPTWLNFNGSQFSGTPANGDITTLSIKVSASDGQLSVSDEFNLVVNPAPNTAPILANAIDNQSVTVGNTYNFTVPANTFTDADNDPLTLTATLSNGSALPNWLSFNGDAFSGTPQVSDLGQITIRVTASDGQASAFDEFVLTINEIPNSAPIVATPLNNQTATENQVFSFAIPNGTFTDADNNSLTLTATLANGNVLPNWLSFNGLEFSGTPQLANVGVLNIKVTASDGQASVSDEFELTINALPNNAPTVANPITNQNATVGIAFTLPIPSNTFNDSDNDPLTLTATLANGNALPNWLTFNGLQFSGTPGSNNTGLIQIKVTASDGDLSVSDEFDLIINGCPPISTLDCNQIKINLTNPFALNFTGNEGGLANTGFTMVDVPSARIAADGSTSNLSVPGFEPSRLSFNNGKLIINANKGIAFVNPATSTETNSQINTLGVGFDANDYNFNIETTIINPYTDGTLNSEQAGLWFGLNEDNFIKLVALNAPGSVELRREVNAVSGSTTTDVVSAAAIAGLHTSTVKLRLNVNISTLIATAFYSLNGGPEIQVGTLEIPASFLNGATVNGEGISFAGIFATKRREATATTVNYTFENFVITPDIPINQPPVIANQSFNVDENAGAGTLVGTVVATAPEANQTLTYNISPNNIFNINASGQIVVIGALDYETTPSYTLNVTATDNGNPNLSTSATITVNINDLQPQIVLTPQELIFDGVKNTTIGPKSVTIQNTGGDILNITSVNITGTNANKFTTTATPINLGIGESTIVQANFVPGTSVGYLNAGITFVSNDPINASKTLGLFGLSNEGLEGTNEPTLNNVVQALGIGINVGWTNLAVGTTTNLLGDEITTQFFEKAGAGNVTLTPVARYSPQETIPFGYYTKNGSQISLNNVAALLGGSPHHQTLFPGIVAGGSNEFDPGNNAFGIYCTSNVFNRTNYSEDALNVASGVTRRARVYPMKNRQGVAITNSYLIAFEDASNGDYQDYVFVLSNVVPVGSILGSLQFEANPNSISLQVNTNGAIQNTLSVSNNSNISTTLNAQDNTTNAVPTWLKIGGNLINNVNVNAGSAITFQFDATGLTTGVYTATVTASANSYNQATLNLTMTVTSPMVIKVNFQDNTVAPPSGYLKDIGQAYGLKTGADQGNGQYTYGWINPTNGQPADLSGVARTRLNTGLDLKISTLIHMDHPTQTNPRGSWEIAVPNGTYQVTVSVGDPTVGTDPETHRVNAENINIINNFIPNTTANSLGRFTTGTANNVVVNDGKLTLSYSGGGVNTKLNYVEITSVNIPAALQFASVPNTISLQAGQNGTLGNFLGTTNNTDPKTATLNAVDNTTNQIPNWLKINGLQISNYNFTTGAEVTFEFDAAGLTAGVYTATVTASANGYQSGSIILTMNVSNPVQLANFKVNFSDLATAAPSGWLKDHGQAFGDRGNGQNYGWMNTSRSATLNLVGNGRNRDITATGENIVGVTLMHMQYDDVPNGTNGVAQEGVWEAQVPNGSYSVTVRVGDSQLEGVTGTKHVVNVEGINIVNFTAVLNSSNDSQGTVTVTVTDGRITLDANGGLNTKIKSVIIQPAQSGQNPAILAVNPANGAVNIAVNTSITANQLYLPNPDINGLYGVDNTTLNSNSVRLFKVTGNIQIPSVVNGTGGGDAITLTPSVPLENNAAYRFEITADVKDKAGFSFIPFSSTFTTTSGSTGGGNVDLNSVSFTKVGSVATGAQYTSLTIGPDGKLYGLTLGGDIHRWTISSVDGSLTNKETLNAWKTTYGDRSAVGLAFSPNSTANNLIAFITHCSSGLSSAPDWDGKISRLTGANLETERLIVTNLPRSLRDHLTNSIAFKSGENNVLYFNQGSNSAGGAPDGAWGNREESLLSGATLRLDLDKLPESNWPLDAKTSRDVNAINNTPVNSPTTTDGLYNPYYINAPLTVFASGIRNAYDLVWHSNGQLYVPANGTAGGSNTPASINGMRRPDGTFYDHNNPNYPIIPATISNETQRDWLFRVNPNLPIGYFGHPNPYRGEFVLNRGKVDVAKYPSGTQADIRYRGAAFDFEFNKSPNGVIEYQSNAENGKLKGAILVVRYSGGDDIIALVPDGNGGDINTSKIGIPGFTGFSDPLDLVEDVNTGNIYVSEFGASRITLLRPNNQASATPVITLSPLKIIKDDVADGNPAPAQTVFLANTGNEVLNNISISITGLNANQFSFNTAGLNSTINAGQSSSFTVTFNPTSVGPKFATLNVSGGNGAQTKSIPLQGLGKVGLGGGNEPSLQWVLDTYFGSGVINVGDDDPSTPQIHSTLQASALLGNEVPIQKFQGFTDGPVSIEVLSVYGPTSSNPVVAFGWYESGNANAKHELFSVSNSPSTNGQTMNVITNGLLEFTPVPGQVFGFYSRWPFFSDRQLFSEDALNTFNGAIPHHIRVYPIPGENNAYILATEEHISGFDYQDIVVIVRNVKPAPNTPILSFNPNSLNFNVGTNNPIDTQTSTLTANLPINVGDVTLSSTANWVTLPPVSLGSPLNFTVNASSLPIGVHNATVTASAPGFVDAQLNITLNKTNTPVWTIKINFQDDSFTPPSGYIADIGSAYGSRGNGNTFGWINPSNGQPKANTVPARGDERGVTNTSSDTDKIMRSLNMFQHSSGAANWEIALANGIYQVEVAAGDPSFYDSQHTIRAEGITLINNFIPSAQNTHKIGSGIVTISDGKLTLDPQGGTNTKINYILIAPINQDLVPPTLTANFIGNSVSANVFRNQVTVALSAEPKGNATTVNIEYSTDNTNFITYSLPITYNQIGNYTLYARATDNLGNITTSTLVFEVVPYVPSNAKIWVKNLDGFPADDELTFSRIEVPWNGNANHDIVTLQVRNVGTGALTIDNLILSDTKSWQILSVGGNPYTVGNDIILNSGANTNIALKFIAKESDGIVSGRVVVLHETLTLLSNSDEAPNKVVKLHGLWQKFGEGDREPFAFEMIDAFGFKTQTGFTSVNGNHNNPIADEIFSPYFVRVDNTKPVTVRQMGAYHGCCDKTEAIWWQPKSNANSNNVIMRHDGLDGQSLLPRKETSLLPGEGTFSPNEPFSIRIAGDNSDPARNLYQETNAQGNIFRGVRIWKAKDSNGNIIPNAYIMSHDYLSATANLDYNDNMYFLSNLKPELGANVFATLTSNPSAHDFGEVNLNQNQTFTINLTNTGQSGDPNAVISSIEIKGDNASEFSNAAPSLLNIAPGASSSIAINFKPLTIGLKNADLLIHYGNARPLRIPLYGIGKTSSTQVVLHHRIKSAANANVSITNAFNNTVKQWSSDVAYRTGSIKLDNTTDVTSIINATDEDQLYRSYLSSSADLAANGYNIPLPNAGTYTVRLHFAENFFTASSARVNNLSIEGNIVYGGLDIYKEVGYKSALVKDFIVNVNDGVLNINLAPFVNRPAISGVEVYSFIVSCSTNMAFTSPVINNADCGQSNGSISIGTNNGNGNVSYKLNNGAFQSSGVFANLAAGTYTITAKESGGQLCEIATQVNVGSNNNPINFSINTSPVSCGNLTDGTASIANVSGTSNYTITWGTIPAQTGNTATGLAIGNYTVTITDINGCAKTQNFTIVKAQGCQETVRINAGGPAQTVGGVAWAGCSATSTCNSYVTGGFAFAQANTITGFTAPLNQTIFQTEWTGGQSTPIGGVAFTYNIPVGNGNYLVRLHFVELNKNGVGLRVFDVNIEGGNKELTSFDIFQQAGGINKAIFREFPVNITDGNVTIQFIKQIENAKISAIEIIPQASDTTPPSPPVLSLVSKSANSVNLSWTGASDNVAVTAYDVYNGNNLAGTTSNNSFIINNLTSNTAYAFTVIAKDAAGNSSVPSNVVNVTTDNAGDTTPPSAPTLNLVSKTHNTVNLAWTAASDNVGVTAYEVYNGANLAGTTAATSLAINNLSPNTAYVFTVIAKDAANNSSVPSNAVNVTTDNAPITTTTRIEAETNFSILTDVGTVAIASTNGGNAAALSNGLGVRLSDNGDKIRITFNVANSGIYQLKARVRAGNATNPTIFWPNGYRFDLDNVQTTFVGNTATLATLVTNLFGGAVMGTMETTNLNLNAGTHTLDVTVLRSSGAIDYIEIIGQSSGTVDTTPPSAPTLNLVSKTHNTVNLAWTAASDNVGVTAYEVYNGANLAGTTAATSFAINNLSPNTAYVFTVIAKDAANNSSVPSNAVNVTTDNAPITTTTRIEAETNFTILTDVGTVAIASTNGGNATALSNGLGVRLSDNGDKIRITFNVATSGIYQLKARVRAGNATNPTIFWPNGYRFDLDNVQTTFVGNTTTLATLVTNLFGGAVMGTMETTNLNLNAGTHTLDVTVLRGSGAIDYIEVVSISATTTTTMAKSRQDNEAMAEAKEDQIDIKRVYPNPIGNAQIIKIQFTKPLNGVVKYYLIDARGIVLQSGQTGSLGQSEIEFNVGDLKSGAYILQLENNELKSKPIRIVK